MPKKKAAKKATKKKSSKKKIDHLALIRGGVDGRLGKKGLANVVSQVGFRSEPDYFISTQIGALDHYGLSCGGMPGSRISEIFGGEGSGKTSFVYSCLGSVQAMGGIGVLIHTEEAGQLSRLETFGVDPDRVVLIEEDKKGEPLSLEQVMSSIVGVVDPIAALKPADRPPILIAYDSIAATGTDDEQAAGGATSFDKRAKIMSANLRVLAGRVAKAGAHLMMVNQNRTKIGVMFGNPTTTPGGHAPKYHASTRIELFGGKAVKVKTDPVGKQVTFKIWKHKLGRPLRKVVTRLMFDSGFDDDWTSLHLARKWKIFNSRGGSPQKAREALDQIGWDIGRLGEFGVSTDVTEEDEETPDKPMTEAELDAAAQMEFNPETGETS